MGSPEGSRVGSRWVPVGLQVPVWCSLPHGLFKDALMDRCSRQREIFHSRVCVVQMVFLKIYFCAFTMFLNNVSISTVEDKPRVVPRICWCVFLSVADS